MFVVYSFVRFVSTPEILERVYTIESEILQIEEAISIQGNNEILVRITYFNLSSVTLLLFYLTHSSVHDCSR